MRPLSTLLICLTLACTTAAAENPELKGRLLAAHESMRPGGTTTLAILIEVPEDWHIYHPIILETGAPTEIEFDLPDGARIGEVRFPEPYLGEEAGIEYLGLRGNVTVLAPLELASDYAQDSVGIGARVSALMCKKLCIPRRLELSLNLPVNSQDPKPANEDAFKEARADIPEPLPDAPYLQGSRVLVAHEKLPVRGESAVIAKLKIKPAHHIQDRDPGVEGLIPTRLFIESLAGLEFADEQVWPEPKIKEMPYMGKVREHSGEITIRAPFRVADLKFEPRPVKLRALLQYQACSEAGQCFMPAMAGGWVEFEVVPAGNAAVPVDASVATKFDADLDAVSEADEPKSTAAVAAAPQHNIWLVLLAAFVGGAILNIMPCVLPVISLKIFSFVQQAGDDRGRIFRMGLMYTAGILASFLVIAIFMVSAGMAWGGLMQQPGFLIGLSAVVFAFGLSLLGVFEIQLPGAATSVAAEAGSKEGYGGAFLNVIFATLLATPCVGPFLGGAVGVLTQLPPLLAGTGIMIVGAGLAAPYLLLTAFPGWLRFLPKPGPWMVTFKQVVGFILMVVVVWLVSVLIQMVEAKTVIALLLTFCFVAFGCWMIGRISLSDTRRKALGVWALAFLVMFGGGWSSFLLLDRESKIPWQPWEPGIAETLAAEGYTVYVDYTATWCLTCQTNKLTVLETNSMAARFADMGVYPIKADFTDYNEQMLQEIEQYGRKGVPTNVVVPAGRPDDVILLPEVLTPGVVRDALDEAGSSRQKPELLAKQP